jgi:hypothetical protein
MEADGRPVKEREGAPQFPLISPRRDAIDGHGTVLRAFRRLRRPGLRGLLGWRYGPIDAAAFRPGFERRRLLGSLKAIDPSPIVLGSFEPLDQRAGHNLARFVAAVPVASHPRWRASLGAGTGADDLRRSADKCESLSPPCTRLSTCSIRHDRTPNVRPVTPRRTRSATAGLCRVDFSECGAGTSEI